MTLRSLVWLLLATQVSAQCTICQDGSPPQGMFGNVDCTFYEQDLAGLDPNSSTCRQFQVEAHKACNCPTYPQDDFCPLCQESSTEIKNPRRQLFLWEDAGTCQDILFSDKSQQGLCERNARAAYYCGCPEAVPSDCSLCVGDDMPTQKYRKVPGSWKHSCLEYSQAADLFTLQECSQLTENLPIDLVSYCACPGIEPLANPICSLCPDDSTLMPSVMARAAVDDDAVVSCADWDIAAQHVTDETYCQSVIEPLAEQCCTAPASIEEPKSAAGRLGVVGIAMMAMWLF